MKKYKKIMNKLFAVLLIFSMLPISVFAYDDTDDGYNKYSNAKEWSVTVAKATSDVTFTTVAFKAHFTIKDKVTGTDITYSAYMKRMNNPNKKEYNDGTNITSYYMGYISNVGIEDKHYPNFFNSFMNQAGNTPKAEKDIREFFAGPERVLYLDSVVVINYDGDPQGFVDEQGIPIRTGSKVKVYDTKKGFLSAANWGDKTKQTANAMYNKPLRFAIQPVELPPTAVITKGKSDTPTSYEEYSKGEPIDLVGRKSWFPEGVLKEYKWYYKSQDSSTWIDGGKNVALKTSDLSIGKYDVKLHTKYQQVCAWLPNPVVKEGTKDATAIIKIIKNDEVKSTVNVTSPEQMEIGENDTFADVPVNIDSILDGVDLSKVKQVEYTLKTPEGNIVYKDVFGPSLNLSQKKTFRIPYKGSSFTQAFTGQVIYTLIDGEMRGNGKEDWDTSYTYIHKKEPPVDTNEPPVPILSPIPDVVVGSDIRLNGASSFDPDGEVVSWDFYVPQWGFSYNEDGKKSTWKTATGTGTRIQAILGVTDDDGAYSETEQFFNVTPPPPILNIDVSGTLKENRKVTFHSNVANIMSYTTSDEQVTWKIKPFDGQDASVIKAKTLTGKNIDTLFKKLGSYYVECTAFNSAGMSSTQSMIIKISEDLKPEVVISSFDTYYRDSEKKVSMTFFDNSESIDGDYIAERSWYYAFDKDNDGSFTDETLTFLKTATLPDDNQLDVSVDHVGKYRIYLRVKEGFGQETIPEFVTSGDYKINNGEKIVEVDNHNPIVSFYPKTEKKIDVVVVTDYTGDKFNQLGTRLNEYVGESFDNYLNVKLMVNTDSKYVGRYLPENAFGWNNVTDNTAGKYEVARWNTYSGQLVENSDNSYEVTASTRNCWPSDISKTTISTFPARIKQTQTLGLCTLILLENGDLYLLGSNMQFGRPYHSTSNFKLEPFKTMSGVKTIIQTQTTGGYDGKQSLNPMLMYVLKTSGDVYAIGEVPYYFKYQGAFFTSVDTDTHLDMARLFELMTVDYSGGSRFSGNSYRTMVGSAWELSKVKGLSNITYFRDTGSGFIARDISGNWWGCGSALNAFGHHTGFNSTTLVGYGSEAEVSANHGMYNTTHHFDEFNNIVKIQTLSDMDKAIGGIYKVDIGKAYGSNGDVYSFKQTPELYFGAGTATKPYGSTEIQGLTPGISYEITYTTNDYSGNLYYQVYYPFQLGKGSFTYFKIGTVEDSINALKVHPTNYMNTKTGTAYVDTEIDTTIRGTVATIPKVDAEYAPSSYYESLLNESGVLTSGTTELGESRTSGIYTTPPASTVVNYFMAPIRTATGEINTFEQFYYRVEYKLVSWKATSHIKSGRRDDDDTTYYDRIGTYTYNVTGYRPETPSNQVVGWKFYGVDLAKLPNTAFRPNSEKYILYLGEKDSFQKVDPKLLDYIKANNIKVKVATDSKYVDRSTTKSVEINLRDMITATPNGKLYASDGLENMLADITEENKNFVEGQDGLYVIKGEDTVTYNSYFSDLEGDTKISEVYNHLQNSTYFENGEGQSAYHNIQRTTPISVFDKVGLYNVFYRAKDQPTTEAQFQSYNRDSNTDELKVYVHRRPIAKMEVQYNNYAPFSLKAFDNTSYDLDHQSQKNRGITEVEWQYRKGTDKNWTVEKGPLGTEIKVANIKKGETLSIYYRVKDMEGVWSEPVIKEVAPEVRLLMDADLKPEKAENPLTAFQTGNHVIFHNLWTSYPYAHHMEIQMYDGKTPILTKVVLTKEKGHVKTEEPYPERTWNDISFYIPQTINGKVLEDKTYNFLVKAIDSEDPTVTKEKSFKVTTISNQAPTVDFVKLLPTPLYEGDQHEVTLKVSDPDNDRLKLDVYLKYDQKSEVLYQSFSNLASGQLVNLKPLTIEEGKTISWRGVVTDPKGASAESKRVLPIEAFGIENISVKGAWQHWRGQKNAFGEQMTNEPYRFLSMEKLTFSVETRGAVDKVSINLSPELEAMTYKDPKGNTYYYKDEVGYNVQFPLALKLQSKGFYKVSYILPFANSTKSWENKSLKKAYHILVTLENQERKRTLIYGDDLGEAKIDITGNIFDLLYNQPAK